MSHLPTDDVERIECAEKMQELLDEEAEDDRRLRESSVTSMSSLPAVNDVVVM